MPDKRRHRGPHPEHAKLFAADQLPAIRSAVADLSWLLSRGYAQPSALQLAGNRYQLADHQRKAVMRCACSDAQREARRSTMIAPAQAAGQAVSIDGYNLLTSIEAAHAGGLLIVGRDGVLRDLASMHGSWRKVDETEAAINLIGKTLGEMNVGQVSWLLDKPVSNSGRLAAMLRETAEANGWRWRVELADDPDKLLGETSDVVVSADSVILDRCARWLNLALLIVRSSVRDAWVVDFSDGAGV